MDVKLSEIITVSSLVKKYDNKFLALNGLNLNINQGEIIALLGPNGAGKTTLISTICGLTSITSGKIEVNGFDVIKDYRKTREIIGLVPQELALEPFEKVINSIRFSRRLFGKKDDNKYLNQLLIKLQLFDKKDNIIKSLSGGMKRRVMIAKALSHNPSILFLDEPTAGVDVELRQDMWKIVKSLREMGVTIILTTHYIEEAEAIADRVGVINQGEIIIVDQTKELLKKMGTKKLTIELQEKILLIPDKLEKYNLTIGNNKMSLDYIYNVDAKRTGITNLLQDLKDAGLKLSDLKTEQNSLEKVFVSLVRENNAV